MDSDFLPHDFLNEMGLPALASINCERPSLTRTRRSTPRHKADELLEEDFESLTEEQKDLAFRRAKNREAARKSRERKLQKIERLQRDVADLERKNNILVRAVKEVSQKAADFEARNNFLKAELETLRASATTEESKIALDKLLDGTRSAFSGQALSESAQSASSAQGCHNRKSALRCLPAHLRSKLEDSQEPDGPSSTNEDLQDARPAKWVERTNSLQHTISTRREGPFVADPACPSLLEVQEGTLGVPAPDPLRGSFNADILPSLNKEDLQWTRPCAAVSIATWPLRVAKPETEASHHMSVEHLAIPVSGVSPTFAHASSNQDLHWRPGGSGLFEAMETKDHASFDDVIDAFEREMHDHFMDNESGLRGCGSAHVQQPRGNLGASCLLQSPGGLIGLLPATQAGQCELLGKASQLFMGL